MKEDIQEQIAHLTEWHRRMENTHLPKIEDGKAICPCCGAEVKRSETIMLSRPPVYTYYCTMCLYTKEHRTFDPIVNYDPVSDNTDNS